MGMGMKYIGKKKKSPRDELKMALSKAAMNLRKDNMKSEVITRKTVIVKKKKPMKRFSAFS